MAKTRQASPPPNQRPAEPHPRVRQFAQPRQAIRSARQEEVSDNVLIKHTMVGPYPMGHVVSVEALQAQEGVDVSRLLNLGAIEYTNEPESGAPLPETLEAARLQGVNPADGNRAFPPQTGYEEQAPEDVATPSPLDDEELQQEIDAGAPEEGQEADAGQPDLNEMTVAELKEQAKLLDIEVPARMTRSELIAAIREKQPE